MKVIILRGGSGAGKSTWIKNNHPDAIIVSADDFFMVDGEYLFDPAKLGEAHASCLRNFTSLCMDVKLAEDSLDGVGEYPLIVDNTNTSLAEFAGYVSVASAFGHDVEISTFIYDPVDAWKRNSHGTPLTACMRQYDNLADGTKAIPPWWNHNYVISTDDWS